MSGNAGPSWRWASEPSSEKVVRHAENALGVTFPADYRACVKQNGGGAPEPSSFLVPLAPDRPMSRSVGILLPMDLQETENVLATVDELDVRGERPDGLVPIINDGQANYVCLDYREDRSKAAPTISFWIREGEGKGTIVFLAGTFSEFLASLA